MYVFSVEVVAITTLKYHLKSKDHFTYRWKLHPCAHCGKKTQNIPRTKTIYPKEKTIQPEKQL